MPAPESQVPVTEPEPEQPHREIVIILAEPEPGLASQGGFCSLMSGDVRKYFIWVPDPDTGWTQTQWTVADIL